MKYAVVQFDIPLNLYGKITKSFIGSSPKNLTNLSERSFRNFSQKYNINYYKIKEPRINYSHPTWERFDIWLNPYWSDNYDAILYADTDVMAFPWAKNPFTYLSNKSIFYKCNYKKKSSEKYINGIRNEFPDNPLFKYSNKILKSSALQAGVYILTKEFILKTRDQISCDNFKNYQDDSIFLQDLLIKNKINYMNIPEKFNYRSNMNLKDCLKCLIRQVHFAHIAGREKDKSYNKICKRLDFFLSL